MQRQLFWSFGVAILLSMLVASGVLVASHFGPGERPQLRPLALLGAGLVVWVLSGIVARRIASPLRELLRVASDLADGELGSRVRSYRRGPSEVRELSRSFNLMADQIERQLGEQRELLGTVSHELRTPLARLRVLLALAQEGSASAETFAKMEAEMVEMDALVGELLALSRVEARAIDVRELELLPVAQGSLERAGFSGAGLEIEAGASHVRADATLLARALHVLCDNAQKHGAKTVCLRATRTGDETTIALEDDGPGFAAADLPRVFLPFVRGRGEAPDESHGVGLGLHLVRRIAEAHGGRAFAENRVSGGARVGFTLRA